MAPPQFSSENSMPQNNIPSTYSHLGQPQVTPSTENSSNVQFYSMPTSSQHPNPAPNMQFYPVSTFPSSYPSAPTPITSYQMFNQFTPSAPFSSPTMQSTVTSSTSPTVFNPSNIAPPPMSGYIPTNSALQGGYRIPTHPSGISSYFSNETLPVRSGTDAVAAMSGVSASFSQTATNSSNGSE